MPNSDILLFVEGSGAFFLPTNSRVLRSVPPLDKAWQSVERGFLFGDKMKRDMTPEIRERILKRDNYTCRYCGSTTPPFHVDHVYPFSKGGITVDENLVTACRSCNGKKSNKIGWLPNPQNINKQIESRVDEAKREAEGKFPIVGIEMSAIGFMVMVAGLSLSKVFGFDSSYYLYFGWFFGMVGICVALSGF